METPGEIDGAAHQLQNGYFLLNVIIQMTKRNNQNPRESSRHARAPFIIASVFFPFKKVEKRSFCSAIRYILNVNWIRHRRVHWNLAGVAFYFPAFTSSIQHHVCAMLCESRFFFHFLRTNEPWICGVTAYTADDTLAFVLRLVSHRIILVFGVPLLCRSAILFFFLSSPARDVLNEHKSSQTKKHYPKFIAAEKPPRCAAE